MTARFNPPPGWPQPPAGWHPPAGWEPDAAWPAPPPGWVLWVSEDPVDGTSPQDRVGFHDPSPMVTSATNTTPQESSQVQRLTARVRDLERALARAKNEQAQRSSVEEVIELDDQRILQDLGIYRYHHPLEDAAAYKVRLRDLEDEMDGILKAGNGVLAADMFTYSGSLAKGRKMVTDLSKLMLRAYNAEADNCVRSLRSGNVTTAVRRLESAVNAIEKLGTLMEMRVNPGYHQLRVQELELTADFQMKVQAERERAREERELLREQRRAEQELAAERDRLEKERSHYQTALAALRAKGDDAAITELAGRLAQIDAAIEANDYRIANIRAGYVYVISNIGAFGTNIVKIGMTRRLEPMDRVRELGDASVPFPYDVHALYFSDDAITLENELHKMFAHRRVNFVNERREFFFATPAEVRAALQDRTGGLLEFTEQPQAAQYFQSKGSWPHFEA